ncbi:MAG TPA: NfeD family protein [Candidatus Methylomirabilis sp.]|nr:NfeD family protein [Candidatus Methylomirabilis sp.]
MLCHLLLLSPLAGLLLFAVLPFPTALALYLPLAALALAIGIPAIRAMYGPVTTGVEGMRGKEGVVVTSEGRSGMLRCGGGLWKYAAPEPLAPGDRVSIVEIDGLTAVVRPSRRVRAPRSKEAS